MRYAKVGIVFIAMLCFSGQSFPQSTEATRVFPTLDLALQAVKQSHHLSVGLEMAPDDADSVPITLDFSTNDVSRLFDSITTQRPAYAWAFEDGVYDLYPKSKTEALSELTIVAYFLKDATPQEASDNIDRLPEIQKWFADHHVTRSEILSGRRWKDANQRISLALNNAQLRAVLNQLTLELGDTQWTIFRWGDHMQYVAIYF